MPALESHPSLGSILAYITTSGSTFFSPRCQPSLTLMFLEWTYQPADLPCFCPEWRSSDHFQSLSVIRNQGQREIILSLVGGNQSCMPIPPSSKFSQAPVIVDMWEVMEVGPASWQKTHSEVTAMLVESNPNDVQLVIDGIPFMKATEIVETLPKNCRW